MTKEELVARYSKSKIYNFSKKPSKLYQSMYEQDASNCWLFSAMNELYINTGLKSDINKIKSDIISLGGNPDEGAKMLLGGLITAIQHQNIYEYMVQPKKQAKEFVKLLKDGFALRMSRKNNAKLKKDIKDDLIVQEILQDSDGRHAVVIYWDGKYFVELGSRGDSVYNNFKYTLNALLGSIKKGTIKPEFYFQFYNNDR